MARVSLVNSTAPNTVEYNGADGDLYDRGHLANLSANYDVHDHSDTYGLGVKRAQTTVAPTAAGHVRVNGDTFQWWAATAAGVYTAVALAGTQTITGIKTFSGNNTHSGTLAMSGVQTWSADPVMTTANKFVVGSDGSGADVTIQKTATRTITFTDGPTSGGLGIAMKVGTAGTDSSFIAYGTIQTPTKVAFGVAGTAADISIAKTAANAMLIDSYPNTGTANAITVGTSGTSNSLKVFGTLYAGTAPFPLTESGLADAATTTLTTANTKYLVTGCSVSLAAGNWMVIASANFVCATSGTGTLTIEDTTTPATLLTKAIVANTGEYVEQVVLGTFTLAATKTVELQAKGSTNSWQTNYGSMVAVRIG